jgi:hypothetical protein
MHGQLGAGAGSWSMDNWELELGAGAGSWSWEHTYAKESAAVRPLQHITRAPSNDKLYYKHNLIIIKYTHEPSKLISCIYIQVSILEYCEGMGAATPLNSTTKAPTHHQIMSNTTSRILCIFIYAIKLIIHIYINN